VAGDPGSDGIVYADLANAPQGKATYTGNGQPWPFIVTDGKWEKHPAHQSKDFPFDIWDSSKFGNAARDTKMIGDAPYGQQVYGAFFQAMFMLYRGNPDADLVRICGLPITPYFFTTVSIAGKRQSVLVQAFERRVLTMTSDGLIEFGNIGQHYERWRYSTTVSVPLVANTTSRPSSTSADVSDIHVPAVSGTTAVTFDKDDSNTTKISFVRLLDPAKSTNQFEQPAAGNKYVALEVIVENIGNGDVYLSTSPYILRATDGFEYHGTTESGVGQPISIDRLTAGGKRQGFVVFEIPLAARTQFVRYKPDVTKYAVYFDFG